MRYNLMVTSEHEQKLIKTETRKKVNEWKT